MTRHMVGAIAGAIAMGATSGAFGQAEVSGWGNLRGIRVGDALVPFETAVGIYDRDFKKLTISQREGPTRTTRYARDGQTVSVGVHLRYGEPATRPANAGRRDRVEPGLDYTVAYTDAAPGECQVRVSFGPTAPLDAGGVYAFLTLPAGQGATARLSGVDGAADVPLDRPDAAGRFLSGHATGVRLTTTDRKTIELAFAAPTDVVVQRGVGREDAGVQVMFPLHVGAIDANAPREATFTLRAAGEADVAPVTVTLDGAQRGRPFDGVGGNFRIQSPRDAQHIDYVFDHLRVAYGRVALPWNAWQPDENTPPPMLGDAATTNHAATQPADGGPMNNVGSAVAIAERLAKRGVPLIVSVWQPPRWATMPPEARPIGYGGSRRLDPAKWDPICQSIGSYLLMLRDKHGAEPELFSFNESNLGINVFQTPEDHHEAIRKLGAHFKAIGLKTKLLLGDTSDVPPIKFVEPTMNDPEATPFVGAIAFHSWRGATDAQYQTWADAAAKLNVPLLDTEGGNDAQAYGYPDVFREAWYALDEAAEYVRILRICQPQSILQWQFTSDYSVLHADADGTLQPTQRFFNLEQMNATPAGATWAAARSSSPTVLPAAFVDAKTGAWTVHLVNDGAARETTITGLPATATRLTAYVTDATRGMAKLDDVAVKDGAATLKLPPRAFVTLATTP